MPTTEEFLAEIQSDDEDVRYAAWSIAEQMDPAVIPALSELLLADEPGVRKAAAEALNNIVHSVGKEVDALALRAAAGRAEASESDKRQAVVKELLSLLGSERQEAERVMALRQLSLIATVDAVPAIAELAPDRNLREEVVFCLERIPGKTSEDALLGALANADDDFKPRVLAALGHRQAEEAMSACLEAMKSPDATLAMAGMKAAARIGGRVGGELRLPDYDALSEWHKTEFTDSLLRYADAQVEKGNPNGAWPIYRQVLEREEEHWQCAAIVAIAKIGTAEAAAAIFPKLRSDDSTVRITAQKTWERMSKPSEA